MIFLVSLTLVAVVVTLYGLTFDLLDKGCLAWHRDAIGYFIQTIIFLVCLLIFLTKMMIYINHEVDFSQDQLLSKLILSFNIFRQIDHSVLHPNSLLLRTLFTKVDFLPHEKHPDSSGGSVISDL